MISFFSLSRWVIGGSGGDKTGYGDVLVQTAGIGFSALYLSDVVGRMYCICNNGTTI